VSETGTREAHGAFPCIDGLRAFAACAVVLCHTAGVSSLITSTGGAYLAGLRAGVQIFFVISGFVLYRPFAQAHAAGNSGPSLGSYFRRRFFRIFPAYWLVLTVGFLVGVIELFGVRSTISQFLLVQGYVAQPLRVGHFIGLIPAWTLVAEVSFYVFLPFYAFTIWWIGHRRPLPAEITGLFLLFAVGMASNIWAANSPIPRAVGVLPVNIAPFALGMTLAVCKINITRGSRAWRWTERAFGTPWKSWLVAAVAFSATVWAIHYPAVLGFFPIPPTTQMSYLCLIDLMGVCVVLPAVFGDQFRGAGRRVLRTRPIVFLGIISYGIYLWHVPVIDATLKFNVYGGRNTHEPRFEFFEVTAVTIALTGLLAIGTWYALEKPLIALSHRPRLLPPVLRWRRRLAPEAPVAPDALGAPRDPGTSPASDGFVALESTTSD